MQLPRVVIAAVFFVIGALIAVPAWIDSRSSSNASESPPKTTRTPATPLTTEATTKATTTARTPTKSPSKSTARPPVVVPPTTPRATTSAPVQPLTVALGRRVSCPGRIVTVTVQNEGSTAQDYTVETDDGSAPKGDRIEARQTRTTEVRLREDRRTRVTVTWQNEPIKRETRTANCVTRSAAPVDSPSPDDQLPHTGSDTAVIWARVATGVGAMITGVIIFWYGGIWPRRRDQIFAKKGSK